MWPKAFAQLIELAPHISRLLPMADRFFQSKTVAEDSNHKAIEAMGDRLRVDLNQITVAQASLAEQISDVSTKLNRLATDTQAAKLSADTLERRLSNIESRQRAASYFYVFAVLSLVAILVLLGLILAHVH